MAGYVKLQRNIWRNTGFCNLTADAQRLYLLLISQPNLSHCGILALTPGRWAGLAADTTNADIHACLVQLETARFVMVDAGTEELWIRTYMRHDEGFRTPNMRKAIETALGTIMSATIREQAEHTAETLGVTLTGTLTERVTETLAGRDTERDASPLQPAACNQQPSTSSLQQQPQPLTQPLTRSQAWTDTSPQAAAAVEIWINHRCKQPDTKHPQQLRKHLEASVAGDWGNQLIAHHTAHPDATTRQILWDIFRLNTKDHQ